MKENRQAYLIQIEGNAIINELQLVARDALEIVEEDIKISAKTISHFIIIEMAKA